MSSDNQRGKEKISLAPTQPAQTIEDVQRWESLAMIARIKQDWPTIRARLDTLDKGP